MILYENTVKNFIYAMKGRNLISYISDEYNSRVGRKISQETKNAWKYSLEVLKQIVVESEVQDDCGIRIDYVILGNAKRFEVIIVGENEQGKLIHVIDLLPWENVSKTDELDMVEFDAGDDEIKKCVHPSYQSISYKKYLPKKNQNIDIYSYVYLFECDKNEETISIVNSYKMLTDEAPIYFAEDQDIVINRLSSFKNCYNGREILNLFHERDQLSSEGVDAFLSGILSDEEIGMLTDDQKTVLASVIKKSEENVNALLLVEGAPGTGKTMLSISCILELVKRDKKVAYLTPTMVQCEMLRNKISEKSDMTNVVDIDVIPRFRINQTRNNKKYDVVFVDESQTLVSKLNSDDKMESINLNTILKSANIVVCLYSSLQIFYGEIMEGIVLKKIAEKNNKAFSQYNLTSNIRYSGRGSGVSWLSHQFQIMDTGNYEDWDSDCFEISVADTPQVLIERLETKSNEGYSAKILVNYRKISDLQHDDDCEYPYYIISGEDYKIPVCTLQSGKTQEWIKDNRFIKYAAGPQVVQGLEFDYVGVIIGKELAFNPESGEIYAIENELDDPCCGQAFL